MFCHIARAVPLRAAADGGELPCRALEGQKLEGLHNENVGRSKADVARMTALPTMRVTPGLCTVTWSTACCRRRPDLPGMCRDKKTTALRAPVVALELTIGRQRPHRAGSLCTRESRRPREAPPGPQTTDTTKPGPNHFRTKEPDGRSGLAYWKPAPSATAREAPGIVDTVFRPVC